MNDTEDSDSLEAIRSDIDTTRADLVETVDELSDRLNPTKRIAAVSQGVSDGTRHVLDEAEEMTRETAATAQAVAKTGVRRGREFSHGRERQLLGSAVIAVGFILLWRLRRSRS